MKGFFRQFRRVLTPILFLAVLVVTAAATWQVVTHPLPEPERVPADQLWYWLQANDVKLMPPASQMAIVRQLQEAFSQPNELPRWPANQEQARQLSSNLMSLTERWLRIEADNYAAQPEEDRSQWLQRRMQVYSLWLRGGERALPTSNTGRFFGGLSANQINLILLRSQISGWINKSPPAERERLQRFSDAALGMLNQYNAKPRDAHEPSPFGN